MKRFLTLAASALALSASPLAAQDFAIVNATLATGGGGEPIENGAVIVDDGEIVYAGPMSGIGSFETDSVTDVKGMWVTPGLFATVTTLGL